MTDWRARRLEDDDELPPRIVAVEAPKCQWCDEPKTRDKDKKWECNPCLQQRNRYPKCPVEDCRGPTYGDDRWCYRHGARKPNRSPTRDEVCFVLINPKGEEKEVYRKLRDPVPGVPRKARVAKDGGEPAIVTKQMIRKRYLVRDVSMMVWRGARLI